MPETSTLPSSPSRLHVLQIVGNAIVGGMETSVERLIQRLPPERFDVSVLCPFESSFTDRLRGLGADVLITPIADEPSWRSIHLACALIRSSAIDVIQSHLPNAHVLAGIVGSLVDKPVLATIHGRQLTPLDIEVHRAAATNLAVVCRHSYMHALGVGANPKQLYLVPNGVDTEAFVPGHPRVGALRRHFGLGSEVPLVGFVGRLSWEKGPDAFLRCALAARARMPEAHFVLVGEGPMRKELVAAVEQFHLSGHVHFAGAQSAMPQVFGELDVVVSSSRSEAMPLVLMEAMASGVPVVACDVGGVADLLENGVSGWLEPEGDYEALACQVVELLQDEALRRSASLAGRRRAEERFTLSKQVSMTIDLLAALVRPQGEARRLGALAKRRETAIQGRA